MNTSREDGRAGRRPSWSTDRLARALVETYPAAAGREAEIRTVRAPGRVNLIGEYTDFNLGYVLPAAIDLEIRIAYLPTDDRTVTLTRLDDVASDTMTLGEPRARTGSFMDYVAGTAWALGLAGHETTGLLGVIGSTLPAGAGLSSSASVELASAWAMLGDPASDLDPMALARICQAAENDYVGVRSGLMDQFAEACGMVDHALFLDCRSLDWRPVAIPDDLALVVCHTGARRELDGSAYNERRAQCEAAVAAIADEDPSVASLRDVTEAHLRAVSGRLDLTVRRRAEHVVSENERVLLTVEALRSNDDLALAELFAASHDSLRERFDVVSPELDAMVAIASRVPGVVAARMTGAGFGGCTVNLVRLDAVERLRAAIETEYPAATGLRPMVLPVRAAAGASRAA